MQGKLHGHRIEYSDFFDKINSSEYEERLCDEFRTDVLGHSMKHAAPYIFPFIIEFSLIGAIVAYVMAEHIGKR